MLHKSRTIVTMAIASHHKVGFTAFYNLGKFYVVI